MENQNKPPQNLEPNPAEAPAKPPEQSAAPPALTAPLNDYTFYNVMPKEMNNSEIVSPVLKTEETPPPAPVVTTTAAPSKFGQVWSKYKIYILCVLALLMGGPALYFGAALLTKNYSKPENLLVATDGVKTAGLGNSTTTSPGASGAVSTPPEWQQKYFGAEICADQSLCGDSADPDRDGLTNREEFQANTDPNNADSDGDGLADGDEVHIFGSSPLDAHTGQNKKYSDTDNLLGGYNIATEKLYSDAEKKDLQDKMKQYSLHSPTLKTLLAVLNTTYGFSGAATNGAASSTAPTSTSTTSAASNLEMTPAAKQDRDAQRSNTIKNLEIALSKFYDDNKTFPKVTTVQDLYSTVRPYLKVALNPIDPVNKDGFVYAYSVTAAGDDFTLSFFSESAGTIIKKHAQDARKDRALEEASVYDDQRKNDLETLRSALLVYSSKNIGGTQTYVFPTVEKYKTELVPNYLSSIPKDPKTQTDYSYQVPDTFDSFTLKAPLDAPTAGTMGFLCNQEECRNY